MATTKRKPKRTRAEIERAERRGLPGTYALGGGLYKRIRPDGRARWFFRWRQGGVLRDRGIGTCDRVTKVQAQRIARKLAGDVANGRDPIEDAHFKRLADRVAAAKDVTFGQCATQYIASHRAGWRNAKHAQQWGNTLATYCADLWTLPVGAVDTALVMKVLEPEWATKTETMSRVRARMENVLSWAITRELRVGPNPAVWRGHLEKLLPKPSKVKRVVHHRALPYRELGDFMTELATTNTIAARALRFQILNACRPAESCGARWDEIDLPRATWTIPGSRMKSGREHRVPLSDAAIAILVEIPRVGDFVFPGLNPTRPITTAATLKCLHQLRGGFDQHGFRSTFRDWCGEQTAFPHDVVEQSLAHALRDATEAAYFRSDLFDKRRRLMAEWARYCATPSAKDSNIIPMQQVRQA